MVDYWGALVQVPAGGPNGEGTYYNLPTSDPGKQWTAPATEDGSSGPTIDMIHAQIMNAKPAHLSALADQWQNMYNMLENISQQLLKESNTLDSEKWHSPAAKAAFLKFGPGPTLAYLDEWMSSALANQSALRAVVSIVQDFQAQMTTLYQEYQTALGNAQNVGGGTKAKEWFFHAKIDLHGMDMDEYNSKIAADKLKKVNETRHEYNRKAQVKAFSMAQQMFDPFSSFASGHGPVFMPPDAVLNNPGHPPLLGAPGGPGGPGGSPGAPGGPGGAPGGPGGAPGGPGGKPNEIGLTSSTAPPPPPGGQPNPVGANREQLLQQFLNKMNPPPAPGGAPGGAPALPPALPVSLTSMGGGPAAANLASNLPLAKPQANLNAPGGANNPFQSSSLGKNSGILQSKASAPGSPGGAPGARPPASPPGTGRSLGGRGRPGAGSEPEGAPNPGSRGKRGVLGRRGGQAASEPGVEEPFGRSSSGISPPVLNNKRPNRVRPGSAEELTPQQTRRSGSPLGSPGGLSRPVLNSPAKSPTESEKSKSKPTRRSAQTAPGSEWLGTEEIRSGAGAPVLDAPELPPTGAAVSGLEEVPNVLRSSNRPTIGSPGSRRQQAPVAPELNRRNNRTTADAAATAATEADEQQIVSDEEAFSVQTPGGGVLGGRQEDNSYRQEPRATLGGT